MSEQTYSQVVGEPTVIKNMEELFNKPIKIESYDKIKRIDYVYNDISKIQEIFNKLFEYQVKYINQNIKGDFGKFICYQIKTKYNTNYNFEYDPKKKILKFSCKYEKTNMIFNYNNNKIRLLSFNKNKFKEFKNEISNENVQKITEMTDGTTIYVIFDTIKNNWHLSTNHKLEGVSNYDLQETHRDIFLKECSEKGYDFNKLMKYLFSNKKDTHVLMFSMRHHLTPIPLDSKENILKLIGVYTVDNKIQERELYHSKFNDYKNSHFADEDIKETIYSVINSISKNIINYLDTKDFISFSEHSGFGTFIPFTEYSFNKEKDLKEQIMIFLKQSDKKFKGLMIYGNEYIEYCENQEYNKIFSYRPKFSLNNQDTILIKIFMFQLELMYNNKKQNFFEHFGDLIKLYDIDNIFEYNKGKVKAFFEGILKWYKMVFIEKTKVESDIPPAYKYLRKYSFPKILDMIINNLKKYNNNLDIENKEDITQLYSKLIIDKLLKDYYEQFKLRNTSRYGNLYNNIFNPILENHYIKDL